MDSKKKWKYHHLLEKGRKVGQGGSLSSVPRQRRRTKAAHNSFPPFFRGQQSGQSHNNSQSESVDVCFCDDDAGFSLSRPPCPISRHGLRNEGGIRRNEPLLLSGRVFTHCSSAHHQKTVVTHDGRVPKRGPKYAILKRCSREFPDFISDVQTLLFHPLLVLPCN